MRGESSRHLSNRADGWARRLTGQCLAPGCALPASDDFAGRWCEPCGEVLRRVAGELSIKREPAARGSLSPKPQATPEPQAAPVPERRPKRADGLCEEECGRPARPKRRLCHYCKTGAPAGICAREGCSGPARVAGYCGRDAHLANPVARTIGTAARRSADTSARTAHTRSRA